MRYRGNKGDIGISKVQGFIDIKSDLRGYRLNGVESLKPVDPLFSDGISLPSHQESASFLGQNSSQSRDEVFEQETYRYVADGSKIPSWFSTTRDNPDRQKSKVTSQRTTDQVNVMSDWVGEEPQDTYADSVSPYTFETRFEREQVPTVRKSSVGNRIPRVSPFSSETSLPRDEIAKLFYQTCLRKNGYPGGQEVSNLEYDKSYEEALGLIPFCITTLTPDHRTYLNFQASLESYNDNYSGDWDSVQYVGRAEKFWGYTGFSRNIDISFKIAIARPEDCEEMYHRLNRLVGATAPSYGPDGLFMRGTLASLTIGDLLKHKDGFINNVKISWQTDYPWEVKSSENSNIPVGPFMVPHVLDISLQFTPIEEKTVTEDNGDYFVFRGEVPTTPEKPEDSPESEVHDIRNTFEIEEVRPQVDHTAVDVSLNVEGGGGGTGQSNRVLANTLKKEQAKVQQSSGIIQEPKKTRLTKEDRRRAVKNQGKLSEEDRANIRAFRDSLFRGEEINGQ